ncbi:MAG: transposase [Bacteroidales bacterium]|nr:transposase [Bacteroidales bacterium]
MEPEEYFKLNDIVNKKRYDALRAFFIEKQSAEKIAIQYGYTVSSFYSLVRDFRNFLKEEKEEDFFFKEIRVGRKEYRDDDMEEMIISLRKLNFSVEEIVGTVQSKDYTISYGYVYRLLKDEGFARLPRRSAPEKKKLELPAIKAPVSRKLKVKDEKFHSQSTGLFAFLPIIHSYGIDKVIASSDYPFSREISRLSSILSFVVLKLSNVKRYSNDDIWCMDRGLGLFAGLNVLPKTAWLSSYSSRVTTEMNTSFLKQLHKIWTEHGLLSDTVNLDFTTIPYWGDGEHLENNWSGKRGKALSSMLAVLAQNPDNGIIDYGGCNVLHKNESAVVLEYLDFYKQTATGTQTLSYLIFDSKFTNYENLSKLDEQQIKFITIRRRGENILENIRKNKNYKTIRVEASGLKKRTLKIRDEKITLPGYRDSKTGKPKSIRQVIITEHGRTKPALIITNDFELSVEKVVRKYCRRWLVEKGIAEQIDFFHLNRVSSSMVIKVDFDLVMTILAHNIYRLFAMNLERYEHFCDERIYEKFIANNGDISLNSNSDSINVELKKKRDLPEIIEMMKNFDNLKYSWIGDKKLNFIPSASS